MNFRSVFFAGLLAAGLFGCGKQTHPRHIVILPDVSGSIDRQALKQAFKAIDELVGHLHREDRIAVIPILADAEAEASGRIIRFEVPSNRQAYDSDLKVFRKKLKTSLATMEAEAVAHPGAKTDILGSVSLAEQEFQAATGASKRVLIILSDFIQEDREIDFRSDKHLQDWSSTRELAMRELKITKVNFTETLVVLGQLRSTEYSRMARNQRAMIREFWTIYFESARGWPKHVPDGTAFLHVDHSF